MAFDRKEYGDILGFLIKADMVYYDPGKKRSPLRLFENHDIVMPVENSSLRKYTLEGVVPWSRYKISLSVFNNDKLYSNSTSAMIDMPEGGIFYSFAFFLSLKSFRLA